MKKTFQSFLLSISIFGSVAAHATAEDWYFHFGIGSGFVQYPSYVSTVLKSYDKQFGPIALDLGFYWPIADGKTIIGPAITAMIDRYKALGLVDISVIKTGVFFSTIHSFGSEPGEGFFVRGDIGFPRMAVDVSALGVTGTSRSTFGFGLLGGGGYGLMAGEGTRLLFSLTHAWSRVEGDNFGATSITFTAMF